MFWNELNAVIETLRTTPEAGVGYKTRNANVVRRILVERSQYHLYYELRDGDVYVLVVWGGRRERGPKL